MLPSRRFILCKSDFRYINKFKKWSDLLVANAFKSNTFHFNLNVMHINLYNGTHYFCLLIVCSSKTCFEKTNQNVKFKCCQYLMGING